MTDSTGTLSEIHSSSSSNEPTETQLAQAGDRVQVAEPSLGTTIQLVAAGDSLQLNFDPADVAKAEVKDGNLEITFQNGAVAVIQGYAEWAAAGGQPTGPQGGVVDVAQLGQPAAPAACELPGENVHVVDVPVPAEGERLTLAVAPGDALRLACSFRDVHGAEVGNNLEMTFPGGGVVVVENFSEWIAAKGSTISDCVCGGVNPADFIVALGLNPEDVLPAAGEEPAGPLPADSPSFSPGPGPEILHSFDHPHILPPTALGYGLPEPEQSFFPVDEENDLVEPPVVTMVIGVDGEGECVEEDSRFDLGEGGINPDNQVAVHANAVGNDVLAQLVITGFNQEPGWTFDFDGMNRPGVTSVVFDAVTGTLTITFGPGVTSFDGTFGVTPPPDSDVDLGTLTATATAAANDNPSNTLSSSTTLDITVDANADQPDITVFTVSDSGDVDSAFSPNEAGTVHVHAVFGDATDGSETHSVTVEIPVGFAVTDPAGGTVTENDDGSHTVNFQVPNGTGSLDVNIGVQASNDISSQENVQFHATATATETTTGDDECDTSTADNVATDAATTTTTTFDDHPIARDNKQCVNEGATQNVVIIADVSGSMEDDADGDGPGMQSRLDLEKAALTDLVNKYAALDGTVTITLIAFASGDNQTAGGTDEDGAVNLGTFTFSSTSDPGYAAALAAIASLEVEMQGLDRNTEYDDALLLAKDVLNSQLPDQADGTTNTVYFLSDGNPNPDSNDADAPGVEWKTFVNDNNIEVVAVGIGSGVDSSELDKVEDHDDKSIIITDPDDLSAALTNVAGNNSVSGNVLTDKTEEANISPTNDPVGSVDTFGNDGAGSPKIISLVHDGHTYDLTDTKGGEGGTVLDVNGNEITILTDLGGTLKFNFATGDYTYTSPDNVDHGSSNEVDERFTYRIQDADGDTDPADLVICIKDNVEPPTVTLAIGVDGKGECVEEDSLVNDPDNKVAVHANAQNDDTLTQLVITGFNQEPGWTFDFANMNQPGVTSVVYDATTGTLTITFGPNIKTFDGTFSVQPPADSDKDLGTLTATATAAAAGDPTQTLDSSTNLDVTVDANADQPDVTVFTVKDIGGDNAFSPNETGTAHVHAEFGDFKDSSETHTVTVDIGDGFTVTNADGGVVTTDATGTHVTFTVPNGTGSLDKNIGIQADNDISQGGDHTFTATATATETTTGDDECDTSTGDNVATDSLTANPPVVDDHPTAFDNKQCVDEGASQNVVLIADVSGSMAADADGKGPGTQSRLDLEKDSLKTLVDKYATLDGTITITLIAFASGPTETAGGTDKDGALFLGTFTFDSTSDPGYAAAIAAINGLAIGLGPLNTETEYDDALLLAKDVLNSQLPGQSAGTANTVYFLSDGNPNPNDNDADAPGVDWKAFVNDHNIEVVAVGIGSGVDAAELDKVEDHSDSSIIITDPDDLAPALTGSAGNAQVSGNVLTDPTEEAGISPANDPVGSKDTFGNDGAGAPKIIDLKVDGAHYDEGSAVGGQVLANDGTTITVQTNLGGILQFNFETGDYTYTAPNHVQHGPPGSPTDTEVDERFTYTIQDSDGDTDPADLVICILDGVPTAADDVDTVQESALDKSATGNDLVAGLVVGSNPGSTAETVTGNILGNDSEGPDGAKITAIKFNGSDVTDASDGKLDGFIDVNTGHSLLHVDATTGEYVYTLFDKTSGDGVKDVFTYTLTDGDGDQAKANLTVNIVDDVPTANDDTDSIGAGGKATGNVITGVDTTSDGPGDDVKGADGAVVTDVDFGMTDGDPGKAIAGNFGTLILNADGSYEYQAKANVSGTEVFTYTLTDGDGDVDTATLTINVGASTPSVAPATDEVHEASLDLNKDGLDLVAGKVTGSNPGDTDETETGKLVFSDPDGASITKITFNASDTAAVAGFIDVDTGRGKLHVNAATGDYTYTLYDKTNGDNQHDDFTYTVTDGLGNIASSTLVINIVDDVPTANDDVDSVGAGGKATGNVITGKDTDSDGPGDDVLGADGAKVTDIDFGMTDGDPGKAIAGNFGTLILNADGSYEYQTKANVSGKDVFTYTLTDGDGDVDTATLTINVGASTPSVAPATEEVHEASLDLNKDGLDLVAGKVTGSNPSDTDETETGKLVFSDPDGASITKITFNAIDTLAVGGFIDVDTGHGKLHVNAATGDYTYTLYDKTSGDGLHDDFGYTVTDTFGNTNSSTLTVNIVDDVPTANDDKDSVGAGGKATGNVITGESTSTDGPGDDVKGADGATVTDVDFGATDGTPGVAIAGLFGTLTLNADGTYEYQAKANVSGTDKFTYTLTDGDGDTDTATLTIDVGASTPVVNPASNTVNEAALDLNKDGKDLAGGTTTGSNPDSTGETVQGTLSFSDPDGASISKITFNGTDFTDAGDGKADGIINVNTPLGLLAVDSTSGAYTYTLETDSLKHNTQGTGIDGVNESFTYTVADKLGNTNSSSLVISVQDDVPTAHGDKNSTTDTQPQDINLVIVFDRSGSMDDDPGVPGYSSRLELAKAAVAALFEAYQSIAGDLHIKIVDFSTGASHSVWLDSPEAANAYLAALEASGTTHYNDAIQELINNYSTPGDTVPDADLTEVYFISDGKPNPQSQSLSDSGTVDQWEDFLRDNDIDQAFAIGVGNGIPAHDPDLEDVAYKDANHDGVDDGNSAIVVTDEGQLLDTLVSTVAGPPISGNVITDTVADVFGADGKGNGGGGLLSIQVGSVTYTYSKALDQITNNFDATVIAGAALVVNTTLGSLSFDFADGDYTLTPINVDSDKTQSFLYTIVDGDGDTSAANLELTVTNAGGGVVTPLSHIGTDKADTIDESGSKADITISGGFGADVLTGGAHNDHIQGGDDDDKLVGNAGNDILIGGDGNDTLIAGDGVDYLFGGAGSDLLVIKDTVNFGHVGGGGTASVDLAGDTARGDILAFDGALDLTKLANGKIDGIETISMTESQGGSGDSTDTLTLNVQDVIDLGTGHFDPSGSFTGVGTLGDRDAIKVDGDATDTLNLTGGGWSKVTPAASHGEPAGYTLYVHDGNPGDAGAGEDAYVLVQNAVQVTTS